MSAALVHQSLELVDPEFKQKGAKNRGRKPVFNLMPENQKLTKQIKKKGRKEKVAVLSSTRKLTVTEAKKHIRSQDEILKENLQKLKAIRKATRIQLDSNTTKQIIERAVTRRPVPPKEKSKKSNKTAFTEEDFKKFEEEYFG